MIRELFRNICLVKVIVNYEKTRKDTEVVADGNRSESLTINQRRRKVFGMLGATAALAIPILTIPGCGDGGDTNSGGGGGSSNLTGFRGNGSSSIEFP